jgi:tetratricopeptide (TPR) repeat protein
VRTMVAIVLLLLATLPVSGKQAGESPAPGSAEFLAAWQAFARPAKDSTATSLDARQQARMAAIPHMEAAVEADSADADKHAALAYIYLSAGKYEPGKQAANRAIDRDRSQPLYYLLRGQAEAALAKLNPETASDRIEPALRAFDDAAHLDPSNSLPLLQAASVALDAGRVDLAEPRVKRALERPGFTFYRLPVPDGLDTDQTTCLHMWQYVQLWQWAELVARCQNVERTWLKLGERKLEEGDFEGAEACFREALEVARRTGSAEPNVFIAVNFGMDMLEDAYARLLRLAEKQGNEGAQRWRGELGVVQIGRQELHGALQRYVDKIDEDPPASIDELLSFEAECVRRALLGVGLAPAETREPEDGKAEAGEKSAPHEP